MLWVLLSFYFDRMPPSWNVKVSIFKTDSFPIKKLHEKGMGHLKGFALLIEGLNSEKEASGIFSSWGGVLNETLCQRGVDGIMTMCSYI